MTPMTMPAMAPPLSFFDFDFEGLLVLPGLELPDPPSLPGSDDEWYPQTLIKSTVPQQESALPSQKAHSCEVELPQPQASSLSTPLTQVLGEGGGDAVELLPPRQKRRSAAMVSWALLPPPLEQSVVLPIISCSEREYWSQVPWHAICWLATRLPEFSLAHAILSRWFTRREQRAVRCHRMATSASAAALHPSWLLPNLEELYVVPLKYLKTAASNDARFQMSEIHGNAEDSPS